MTERAVKEPVHGLAVDDGWQHDTLGAHVAPKGLMLAPSYGLIRETSERLEGLPDVAEVGSGRRRGDSFVEQADHVRRSSEPHVRIYQRFTSFIGSLGGRGFTNGPLEEVLGVTSAVEG
jgi:hypothetical protein